MVSNNLEKAAKEQNRYLIKKSIISHEGENTSQVSSRAVNNGATAFYYGEIIGFSPTEEDLFKGWILSPTHNTVLNDPKWTWVGLSVEYVGELFVAVVNFSTGNIGSTYATIDKDIIHLKGIYIEEPKFEGDFELINYIHNLGDFDLFIKATRKEFFIYAYNEKGELTDRVDLFFK